MAKHIIIGYSGHAFVVLDAAEKAGLKVLGYTEKNKLDHNPFELDYLGFENDEDFQGWNKEYKFVLGIGDNKIRNAIAELIKSKKEELYTVMHPSSNPE